MGSPAAGRRPARLLFPLVETSLLCAPAATQSSTMSREGAELFDSLFGKGNPVYHTGGYLKQGEVVWLQAKLPKPIIVADDDQLDTFLLFSNSHDGTYPIDIRISTVRVVCNNTLNLALRDKTQGRVFRRGHSDRPGLVKEEAAKFFEVVLAAQCEAQARMNALAQAACEMEAFTRFLEKLLPIPADPCRSLPSQQLRRETAAWRAPTRHGASASQRSMVPEKVRSAR